MRLLEEKHKLEKEEWQSMMLNKLQKEALEKEKEMRIKLRNERDAEIEMIVQRLEAENSAVVAELERKYRKEKDNIAFTLQDDIDKVNQLTLIHGRLTKKQSYLKKE